MEEEVDEEEGKVDGKGVVVDGWSEEGCDL